MRVGGQIGGLLGLASFAIVATTTLVAAAVPAGGGVAVVPPAPCSPAVVMNDPEGDGHHGPTDVLRAWFSEANGGLQAVIEVAEGKWTPDHDEPEVIAGYAFIFNHEGQTRYVRMSVDDSNAAVFDHGTWALDGLPPGISTFTQQGLTTGERDPATALAAAVWIDVPGIDPGDLLTDPFVLTYDGIISGVPTDVDQAPGGEHPTDPARGPDYRVGSCSVVSVAAPASIKGGKTVTVSGSVEPAAEDVDVTITRTTVPGAVAQTLATTDVNGDYSAQVPVKETTFVKATANGIDSTTRKITVRSTVTIRAVRLRNGKTRIQGVARPRLPGRIQLIKTTAFRAAASKTIAGGSFRFTARKLKPGRWQVIYTPRAGRAVRSISPAVRVR